MLVTREEKMAGLEAAVQVLLDARRPGLSKKVKIFRQYGLTGVDRITIHIQDGDTGQASGESTGTSP